MDSMKNKLNLQLFAEGGAGVGASTGATVGGDSGAATNAVGESATQGDLSKVVYGKSDPNITQSESATSTESTPEDRLKLFDNMIKKGGDWHDEFTKRTQDIVDKRFAKTKGLEEQVKSFDPIMQTLAAKYGVEATDTAAIAKALDEDTSMFEDAAFKEGLSPEQYRQKLALERENAQLKEAEQRRQAEEHSQQIYTQWLKDAEALGQKYGRQIDLATECQNQQFMDLLANGVQFEAAYKAIHADEMLNGAMAFTAQKVEQALVNKATSYAGRPVESGSQSSSTQVFKSDPNQFTDADMKEIRRRAEAGERIVL
jgi:hypothetical protein